MSIALPVSSILPSAPLFPPSSSVPPPLDVSFPVVIPLVPVALLPPPAEVVPQQAISVDAGVSEEPYAPSKASGLGVEPKKLSVVTNYQQQEEHSKDILGVTRAESNRTSDPPSSTVAPYPPVASFFHSHLVHLGGEEYREVRALPPPRELELSSSLSSSIRTADELGYIVFGGVQYPIHQSTSSSKAQRGCTSPEKRNSLLCYSSEGVRNSVGAPAMRSGNESLLKKHDLRKEREILLEAEKRNAIEKRTKSRRRRNKFLSEQLSIGYEFLHMEHKPTGSLCTPDKNDRSLDISSRAHLQARSSACTLTTAEGSTSGSSAPALCSSAEGSNKWNWWALAVFGSPSQLLERLHTEAVDSQLMDSIGYVNYHRRLWGLKKSSNTYSLGFGTKATALQFAAVMGRLDNVLFLVLRQAKDTPPFLKDLLSESAYSMICTSYYQCQLSANSG